MIANVLGNINYLVDRAVDLKGVWIHLFADLALEILPVKAANVGNGDLLLLLRLQPLLETLEVDEAYRAGALAGHDERILRVGVAAPAEAAMLLLVVRDTTVLQSADTFCLLQLLSVHFGWAGLLAIAAEVFDTETHASDSDGVELLNTVVTFTVLVL